MPLLFFHGLGGNLNQCLEMLKPVKNIKKIVMDARGHGTTPLGSLDGLNFSQFATDAQSLIQHLKIKYCIAGGISMGSGIAIALTLMLPQLIKGLILVRPAWLCNPHPENLNSLVIVGQLLKNYSSKQAKQIFIATKEYAHLKEVAPAVADSLLKQFDAPNCRDQAEILVRIPNSAPFAKMKDLSQIQAETLILATKRDPIHPFDMAQALNSGISKSQLIEVVSKSEDVDEHLAACAAHIGGFVNKLRFREKTSAYDCPAFNREL